jgi:hypothetical protein
MAGFTGVFPDNLVLACFDVSSVSVPKIAECLATSVRFWYQFPEFAAAFFAPATNEIRYYLPCSAA